MSEPERVTLRQERLTIGAHFLNVDIAPGTAFCARVLPGDKGRTILKNYGDLSGRSGSAVGLALS